MFEGIEFPSVEHAYVAAKTLDRELREQIAKCETPGKAKRMGRKMILRDDWDAVKVTYMRSFLRQKFSEINGELHQMLADTGDQDLVEGNHWHDNYWGVCSCEKCLEIYSINMLGRLLMEIRDDNKT